MIYEMINIILTLHILAWTEQEFVNIISMSKVIILRTNIKRSK